MFIGYLLFIYCVLSALIDKESDFYDFNFVNKDLSINNILDVLPNIKLLNYRNK